MPTLGAPLDLAKYEARNFRSHQLGAAPSSPVTGQLYYNTGDNTLYVYDGTQWYSTRGAGSPPDASAATKGLIQLAGDLGGTAAAPVVANGVITSAKITDGTIVDTDVAAANKDGGAAVPSLRTLGTSPTQAAAGNDSRFSDSRNPSGAAGGDLAGSTYPNPVLANGVVTSAKIADGTITDTDVAAANKDGASGTPSMRRLGYTAGMALDGTNSLSGIANNNPTFGDWGNNLKKIMSLADPTAPTDAANKQYVDATAQGLDAKASARVAYGSNITLSGAATASGPVTPNNGERVLVMGQTSAPANGLYIVNTGGAWTRTTDADTWNELVSAFVFVEEGTYQDNGFVCTVDAGGTLGTTNVTWTQFSGAGQITAGAGMTKSGNTLDVVATAGGGLVANADDIGIAPGGVTNAMHANASIDLTTKVTAALPIGNGGTGQTTQKTARETGLGAAGYYNNNATHGAGTTITIAQATHGLRASRAIMVQVQDNATGNIEIPDASVAANGDVTITYGASVGANTKLVTLIG